MTVGMPFAAGRDDQGVDGPINGGQIAAKTGQTQPIGENGPDDGLARRFQQGTVTDHRGAQAGELGGGAFERSQKDIGAFLRRKTAQHAKDDRPRVIGGGLGREPGPAQVLARIGLAQPFFVDGVGNPTQAVGGNPAGGQAPLEGARDDDDLPRAAQPAHVEPVIQAHAPVFPGEAVENGLPRDALTQDIAGEHAAFVTVALVKIGAKLMEDRTELADDPRIEAETLVQQAGGQAGLLHGAGERGGRGPALRGPTQASTLDGPTPAPDARNPSPGGPGR